MAYQNSVWSLQMLDMQKDFMTGGAAVASRSVERLLHAQMEGCREWADVLATPPTASSACVERHIDHSLHMGWQLFVAQVAAITDGMQLVERAVAESNRNLLSQIESSPGTQPALQPVRCAVCFSSSAYESMSKATRQVANFASNRFSAAAVSAFHQACDRISETA